MVFKNAIICDKDFNFIETDIETEGKIITHIGPSAKEGIDLHGKTIIPGFVDIHIHGCNNADCSVPKQENIDIMSRFLASKGVTSFCPTTMTLPEEYLVMSFSNINNLIGKECGAYIHGINMEGPFISPAKKGAQKEEYIRNPDVEMFERLNQICKISLVDIAPELPGSDEFIKKVKEQCVISAAHTTAGYNEITSAISKGLSHATHLFNAMSQFGSREPGAVGAFFDSSDTYCEMICDGIHINPASLRTAFKILGENRTVVISDAMMASGLSDGTYSLGGQTVIKRGQKATLEDGTLAGSVTNLHEELLNLIKFGIPVKQALKSVSINPAKSIKVDKICGSIEEGKNADFIITDENFVKIDNVVIKGKFHNEGNLSF